MYHPMSHRFEQLSCEPHPEDTCNAMPCCDCHDLQVSRASAEARGEVVAVQALGADPDIYEKLTASLAPSIWQLDDVKKGILCQLFGGTTKVGCAFFFGRSEVCELSSVSLISSNISLNNATAITNRPVSLDQQLCL